MTNTAGQQYGSTDQPAPRTIDKPQFIVSGVFAAVGAFIIVDALRLTGSFAKVDPLGPKVVPLAIGIAMVACAIAFAVAVLRGSKGIAEEGEDIDLSEPSDWRTVGLLVGVFVVTILLVDPLGWPLTATFLFAAAAVVLGNKHYVRNVAIGAALGFGTFYAFYVGLGIPLPAGILDGIL